MSKTTIFLPVLFFICSISVALLCNTEQPEVNCNISRIYSAGCFSENDEFPDTAKILFQEITISHTAGTVTGKEEKAFQAVLSVCNDSDQIFKDQKPNHGLIAELCNCVFLNEIYNISVTERAGPSDLYI